MAVVAGEQAGLARGNNVIAHNVTTGREGGGRQNKGEMSVSTLLQALLKSAKSTSGRLLSERCLFLPCLQQQQKAWKNKRAQYNHGVALKSASF